MLLLNRSLNLIHNVCRHWLGPSLGMVVLVVVLGRLLVEPARTLPRFDKEGMDPFSVVEVYRLRGQPEPFTVALLGSSVSIWGILPEVVAEEMGLRPQDVRKLAIQAGTPFDMWHLVERNPERFENLRMAVVEVNPRMLDEDTESHRTRLTASQHATYQERQMMYRREERWRQRADFILPVYSVRRPLKDVFLNIWVPDHSSALFEHPDLRLEPFNAGWKVQDEDPAHHRFVDNVPAEVVARRLVGSWRLSRLYDRSLRNLLEWFHARNIRVVLHQLPVHPHVGDCIATNADNAQGYVDFEDYLETLRANESPLLTLLATHERKIPVHGMRDHTHLNEIGANIYSRELGRRLRSALLPEQQPIGVTPE